MKSHFTLLSLLLASTINCAFAEEIIMSPVESSSGKNSGSLPSPASASKASTELTTESVPETVARLRPEAVDAAKNDMGRTVGFISSDRTMQLFYPACWQQKDATGGFIFRGVYLNGLVNLNITRQKLSEAVGTTLDKYVDLNRQEVQKIDTPVCKYEKTISDEKIDLNGIPMQRLVISTTDNKGEKSLRMNQQLLIWVKDGNGYISCSTLPESYADAFQPVIDGINKSIKMGDFSK